jgi:hypothetical protein
MHDPKILLRNSICLSYPVTLLHIKAQWLCIQDETFATLWKKSEEKHKFLKLLYLTVHSFVRSYIFSWELTLPCSYLSASTSCFYAVPLLLGFVYSRTTSIEHLHLVCQTYFPYEIISSFVSGVSEESKNYPITGALLRDDDIKPKRSTNSLGLKTVLCLLFLPPSKCILYPSS